MKLSTSYRKIYGVVMVATLFLIALGGAVRAMNAGLACPDWPLCFGDIIPDYHPQVYFEFIHRVLAGIIGLVLLVVNTLLIFHSQVKKSLKGYCLLTLALLTFQVVMGGLTVLWQIQAKVVTIHLMSGILLFGLISWTYFLLKEEEEGVDAFHIPVSLPRVSAVPLFVILGQILLGGLVASHYAALVCVDFPLCHGKLFPTFQGVIGLQVLHRLGAYITLLVLVAYFYYGVKVIEDKKLMKLFYGIGGLIVLQFAVGILNVLLMTPPLITVLHLFLGAALFWVALKIFFHSRYALDN